MEILQVNSADRSGGAERIAVGLHREFRGRGHGASLAVGHAYTNEDGVFRLDDSPWRGMWSRSLSAAARRVSTFEGRVPAAWHARRLLDAAGQPRSWVASHTGDDDFDHPASRRILDLVLRRPDVLHAHNLHGGYFDLRALAVLSSEIPVFLTLHDAWLLTGHCAHSFDCERWLTGCGHCPDLAIYPSIPRDATARNWNRKRAIYEQSAFRVATPSRWLMERVERSMLAPAVVESRVIPNGIDAAHFGPRSKEVARRRLGLPNDRPIILTASNSMTPGLWKDAEMMRAAIALGFGDAVFLTYGDAVDGTGTRTVPLQTYEDMPDLYAAADVYVHPARVDTFPNSVLESLSCGTPVVATAVGGIPEQIADSCTGFLVEDAQQLSERVRFLVNDAEARRAMGARGRDVVLDRFTIERQADAYLAWYFESVDAAA